MDLLVETSEPRTVGDDTPDEIAILRAQLLILRRENLELRQQAGYWKSCHERALERNDKLQLENDELRAQIRQLRNRQFGTSTEKQSKTDRSNTLEGFDDQEPDDEKTKKKRVVPKRRNYDHLPAKTEVIELPVERRGCPQCGQPRVEMTDTEDSEQLEIEVKAYRRAIRRKRYRPTCGCPDCPTITAPVPAKLIPKSRLGISIWIEILLAKYHTHLPIERQLGAWSLLDFDVAASTVNTGLERLQPLFTPIYEMIRDRNRLSKYHQADETRWFVFAGKTGKVGRAIALNSQENGSI